MSDRTKQATTYRTKWAKQVQLYYTGRRMEIEEDPSYDVSEWIDFDFSDEKDFHYWKFDIAETRLSVELGMIYDQFCIISEELGFNKLSPSEDSRNFLKRLDRRALNNEISHWQKTFTLWSSQTGKPGLLGPSSLFINRFNRVKEITGDFAFVGIVKSFLEKMPKGNPIFMFAHAGIEDLNNELENYANDTVYYDGSYREVSLLDISVKWMDEYTKQMKTANPQKVEFVDAGVSTGTGKQEGQPRKKMN
jgi:hypothetical protein